MGWKQASYASVRNWMQPGDIIAFSSNQGFSRLIKMATRSQVTHVGIVVRSQLLVDEATFLDLGSKRYINQVLESTTVQRNEAAVVLNRLSDRVKFYPGEMWWLPLDPEVRQRMDMQAFYHFLLEQSHKTFDVVQAIKAAFDLGSNLPLSPRLHQNVEDYSKLFCSEMAAAAMEVSGAIASINASEVTPIDLCMFRLYWRNYYQLKGEPKQISGYNSINPESWG